MYKLTLKVDSKAKATFLQTSNSLSMNVQQLTTLVNVFSSDLLMFSAALQTVLLPCARSTACAKLVNVTDAPQETYIVRQCDLCVCVCVLVFVFVN